MNYQVLEGGKVPIKAWVNGVPLEYQARQQLINVASMPFIYKWIAAMPDTHFGLGATIGSVIPTVDAVMPSAVGVDIGCGLAAVRTDLNRNDLGRPQNIAAIRKAVEKAVPHGRTSGGGKGDRGAWGNPPEEVQETWEDFEGELEDLVTKAPKSRKAAQRAQNQLGTLGGGNHFIEVSVDEQNKVWIVIHSGSRGIGNSLAQQYIRKAQEMMKQWHVSLPDRDLAYFPDGTPEFYDYLQMVNWAQRYAQENRKLMIDSAVEGMAKVVGDFDLTWAVDCHHNYIQGERHYGQNVLVTRKGAISAKEGQLGIIPGSMGSPSFVVRGKGNRESFHSAAHGAGRRMSRRQAKETFSIEDHEKATEGVECRKDQSVLDETPGAYKDIRAVMKAQEDLIEPIHELKQAICIKG